MDCHAARTRAFLRIPPPMTDPFRQSSPAAERNRQPILEVLRRVLPASGRALEIASGSGQHVSWFARHLPTWTWQPTEYAAESLTSIAAWSVLGSGDVAESPAAHATEGPLPNVLPPLRLDVCAPEWPVAGAFGAITCVNMIHASPPQTLPGLMQGAGRHLAPDGLLVTYGPYILDDEPLAASNVEFDAWLKSRDPSWGIRRLADVVAHARDAGLRLRERIAMPANNLMLVFERQGATP
jgi:SAM-dependent methyltransferase